MALTGTNVPLGKLIVAEIPVYVFTCLRFLIASAALAILAHHEPGPRLRTISRRQGIDLVAMAALGMVGFTVLLLEGLKRTSAVDAGIITATMPAVVALLGALFMRERLTPLQALAVALAVGGLMFVQVGGADRGSVSWTGNLLIGGAVLGEASFVLLGKRLAAFFGPIRLALGGNVAALVLSLPLAAFELGRFNAVAMPAALWVLVVWYAISASVLCQILWYRGVGSVETWLAGLTTAAMPVAALVAAHFVLGEEIGPARLAGAALVIAAIALAALSSRNGGRIAPS
jgi:drug/metabolite transporter (DMT)-like permease